MTSSELLFVALSYLIGSVSFTRVIARLLIPNTEISSTEMEMEGTSEKWVYRGVSATTLLPRVGAKWMVLVIVLDAAKAAGPTIAARLTWPESAVYLAVALATIAGHVWPAWHRFEGGRGQSSILGVLLVIDPLSILFVIVAGGLFGLLLFTSSYFARNGSPIYLPFWFVWRDGFGPEFAFSLALSLLYIVAIRPDITEENRVRKASGMTELPWSRRLSKSVGEFFSMTDS